VKVGAGLFVSPAGPESIDTAGGVVSTTNDCPCAVPVFPSPSLAMTLKVCEPSARAGAVKGEEQDENASASMAQSNATALGSVEEKVKVGAGLLVGPAGPESIVVSSAACADAGLMPKASTAIRSRHSENWRMRRHATTSLRLRSKPSIATGSTQD